MLVPLRASVVVLLGIAIPVLGVTIPSVEATHPNVDGPPLAHTGGFGEPDCRVCHDGGELNAPGGALGVDGLPARYKPGETYEVRVVLMSDDFEAAGFQGAFRIADGTGRGHPAGQSLSDNDKVLIRVDTTGVEYVFHSQQGSAIDHGGRLATWSFRWTAPQDSLDVVFHVAANAANGDNSPFGDLIYTMSVHTSNK